MPFDAKEMTDYELIRACLETDNAYFAELVERYKNLVYSIILRMQNDREEANDLAQEVFIKIYKNLMSNGMTCGAGDPFIPKNIPFVKIC